MVNRDQAFGSTAKIENFEFPRWGVKIRGRAGGRKKGNLTFKNFRIGKKFRKIPGTQH